MRLGPLQGAAVPSIPQEKAPINQEHPFCLSVGFGGVSEPFGAGFGRKADPGKAEVATAASLPADLWGIPAPLSHPKPDPTDPPKPTELPDPDQILLLRLVQLVEELGELRVGLHLAHDALLLRLALSTGQQGAVEDWGKMGKSGGNPGKTSQKGLISHRYKPLLELISSPAAKSQQFPSSPGVWGMFRDTKSQKRSWKNPWRKGSERAGIPLEKR